MEQVRFDLMVPAEIRARREACNLAYLPVGSLEWHGPHMPFGTDYLTVTHLADQAARREGEHRPNRVEQPPFLTALDIAGQGFFDGFQINGRLWLYQVEAAAVALEPTFSQIEHHVSNSAGSEGNAA